jgi:hypothetical protein
LGAGAVIRLIARKSRMRREEKRARSGSRRCFAFRPAYTRLEVCRSSSIRARVNIRGYRSVLVPLKYGRTGRAIMTTAIASPASNEIVTINILLTHFVATPFIATRQIVNSPNLLSSPGNSRSSLRVASEERSISGTLREADRRRLSSDRALPVAWCAIRYARLAKEKTM